MVGNDPSASFPGQSLSFCFPVLSCFLLLKRKIVAPPINPSSFPHETSQTYIPNKIQDKSSAHRNSIKGGKIYIYIYIVNKHNNQDI